MLFMVRHSITTQSATKSPLPCLLEPFYTTFEDFSSACFCMTFALFPSFVSFGLSRKIENAVNAEKRKTKKSVFRAERYEIVQYAQQNGRLYVCYAEIWRSYFLGKIRGKGGRGSPGKRRHKKRSPEAGLLMGDRSEEGERYQAIWRAGVR